MRVVWSLFVEWGRVGGVLPFSGTRTVHLFRAEDGA